MTVKKILEVVLPKFVESKSEQEKIRKIKNNGELVSRMFNIIYDHPQRQANMEGWGTTNTTIKQARV